MYGVVAMQTPGDEIDVAGASIDFLNEVYTIGGVSYTAAEIIDKPGRVGASGLEILDDDPDGIVEAIGPLQAALLAAHWTIVIEYEVLDTSGFTDVLAMKDDDFNHSFEIYSTNDELESFDNIGFIREVEVAIDPSPGIRRVALTHTSTELSISGDGGAAVTELLSLTLVPTSAAFGYYAGAFSSNEGFYLRTLEIMAPVPAAELPALSA